MDKVKNLFFLFILFLFSTIVYSSQSGTLSVSQIAEKYGKAVVLIEVSKGGAYIALGSGFIVNSSGIIITNYHVIEGAFPVIVKLTNGDIYEDIGVIDIDEKRDIAIIKIKGWNLPGVKLGNSDTVKVGEQIVVIGNPEGLENTVSDGLISAIRDTGKGYKMNQISAPISAGSSGSPVFNMKGEVTDVNYFFSPTTMKIPVFTHN
jgi:S1-C subfamily serine protease